jgi:putative spermidine/putrescine transport system permease protein
MDSWRTPRRLGLALFVALTTVFLVLPLILVVPVGFSASQSLEFPPRAFGLRWYERLFTEPAWRDSLITSFQIAIGTVVLTILLGVPMALGMARGHFRGQSLVYGLLIAPLAIPTVIVAIGVYYVWTIGWRIGPITIGGHLTGSIGGLILAHTGLAVPMLVILATASLRTIDRSLELAASGLGANPWRTFRAITLPLMLPGIAAGAVFAFLTSWDEALVSLFLTNAEVQTFPVRMFTQVREAVDPTVASAATMLIAITSALFTFTLLSRSGGIAPDQQR